MLSLDQRIEVFSALGTQIKQHLENPEKTEFPELEAAIRLCFHRNGWFTPAEVNHALRYWAGALARETLEQWAFPYLSEPRPPKRVGLVLAGNIPMVGFHDVLCTILAGHVALIKCSSSDDVLIPALMQMAVAINPGIKPSFEWVPGKLSGFDAVIATGSNNSTRYFEAYFKPYPHIIRKNRTGIAILDGSENEAELRGLMEDSFRYYGLGCRSVTRLFLPDGYDLNKIFHASLSFSHLMENKKYANNYTYYKALMMMQKQNVLENELVLLTENPSVFSPVSVLHYGYYHSVDELNETIEAGLDDIQCVVGRGHRPFGSAQHPALNDYADGIDTMLFLSKLS